MCVYIYISDQGIRKAKRLVIVRIYLYKWICHDMNQNVTHPLKRFYSNPRVAFPSTNWSFFFYFDTLRFKPPFPFPRKQMSFPQLFDIAHICRHYQLLAFAFCFLFSISNCFNKIYIFVIPIDITV